MSTDYSASITPSIHEAQFTGRDADHLAAPESQEIATAHTAEVVFDHLTFDPKVVTLLHKSYNDSFASIPSPDLSVPQDKQTLTSNLAAIARATQGMTQWETQNHPIQAQSLLGDIQQALNAAQQIYNEYYAPGAPHADQVQGYRLPMQEIHHSIMTVQQVAGLALIQNLSSKSPETAHNDIVSLLTPSNNTLSGCAPSTPGSSPSSATLNTDSQTAATSNFEEQLASSSSNMSASHGLTVNEAIYEAGESFSSLLQASHRHQNNSSLEALRKLLVELNIFRADNMMSQRHVEIKKELKDRPLEILEAEAEERINSAENLVADLRENMASQFKSVSLPSAGIAIITNPSAMAAQLSDSLQRSNDRLTQLIEGIPLKQLNASLL